MTKPPSRDIFFSFFMFTANMNPTDSSYTKLVVQHMKELRGQGYTGFDLPIAPPDTTDFDAEVVSYENFRHRLDDAGLEDVKLSTNVGATQAFDPSSPLPEVRELGLKYLKSRVSITHALRGNLMAGPIALPYGLYPTDDKQQPIWSDALQDWAAPRYVNCLEGLEQLGKFAAGQNVKLAIEPVDHWETPAPCTVADVLRLLLNIQSKQVGICIDSAHVVLGSQGPASFQADVAALTVGSHIHSVHISAPDRGEVADSWIPWQPFLRTVLKSYEGPLLIEVFNAIPAFLTSLRLTRRQFRIPGEEKDSDSINAYKVAEQSIATLQYELQKAEA
jgi:sugar phosphate isomerase/epimerase